MDSELRFWIMFFFLAVPAIVLFPCIAALAAAKGE